MIGRAIQQRDLAESKALGWYCQIRICFEMQRDRGSVSSTAEEKCDSEEWWQ